MTDEHASTMDDAAEMLWIVLANVSGGDWTQQSLEWQEAAARWRDHYFRVLSSRSPQSAAAVRDVEALRALVTSASDAYEILEGLRLSVQWEIAPSIMKLIERVTVELAAALIKCRSEALP